MQGIPDSARRFAALAALGFERVEPGAVSREVEPVEGGSWRVVHARPAMGTRVSVTAIDRSPDRIDGAVGRAFEEMDRLIDVFSHHDAASAASALNFQGRLADPPPELVEVVQEAVGFHRLTQGAFDVTVAPVIELFRQSATTCCLPGANDLRAALELIGSRRLQVSRQWVAFERQGMKLTLDGIAKGYIVDSIARLLDRHRIGHYLIEAGGDIRTRGCRGNGLPWRIAIQDPDGSEVFPDRIHLATGAVATSGGYEEFYDPQEEHHHIICSDTGESPRQVRSVTVTAPNAMMADALATGIFPMPPEAALRFVETLRGCQALIIGRDGAVSRTRGWRSAGDCAA